MTAPNWTKNERTTKSRPTEQATRVMALWLMMEAGELDLSNKSGLAARLGIHRHTLDRDLNTIEMARAGVEDIRRKLKLGASAMDS